MVVQNPSPAPLAGLAAIGEVQAPAALAATALFALQNGTIDPTVGANALTVSLKTLAATTPTPLDPVWCAFRSATAVSGLLNVRAITSAVTLTVPDGATLGASSAAPFRLWFVLFDIGDGTFKVGVKNCSTASAIYALGASGIGSATAIGTGSDSAGVFYADATVTSKPFRVVGFMDWSSGLTTAGTWNALPGLVQLYGQGIKMPGDVVGSNHNIRKDSEQAPSGATRLPLDYTIPQNTEGHQFFSTAYQATSLVNHIEHDVRVFGAPADTTLITMGLFEDSVANAIGAGVTEAASSPGQAQAWLVHRHRPTSLSEISYKVRVSDGGAGTFFNFTLNADRAGGGVTPYMGGVMSSWHKITEYMA